MKKLITHLFSIMLLVALHGNHAAAQMITVTLAGNQTPGYTGDGGPARYAQIAGPKDLCIDAKQNLYFTDKANGRIRMISSKGIITTIAGGGTSFADNIPALDASFSPNYICIATNGNLYFTTSDQVKMIDAVTHKIKTVAGIGTPGFSGDNGPAIAAALRNPQGICIDAANNIYVVDRGNDRIRKITASTGKISTIIGTGVQGYAGDDGPATAALIKQPVVVSIDVDGNLYFSDQSPNYPNYDNSVIRRIDAVTGIVSAFAGDVTGGPAGVVDVPATAARLGQITGICCHDSDVYVNEMSCSCRHIRHHQDHHHTDSIRIVGGDFGIESYSNDTTSPLANMNIPYGVCVDKYGAVYIADSGNQLVRKILPVGHTPTFVYGHNLYIDPTAGIPTTLSELMWITDIDPRQTETWSVVTPPMHGLLAGFPSTAMSRCDTTTSKPFGLSYTVSTGYLGNDFFKVRVTDGTLSDTVSVYVGPHSLTVHNLFDNLYVQEATMHLFPNPASAVLNIEHTTADNADITISDVTGRLVYKTTLSGSQTVQVDISAFSTGVYFVSNGLETQKFVKE